jgi:hypothetical protein
LRPSFWISFQFRNPNGSFGGIFPIHIPLGLPYGVSGILLLFSIHAAVACLLGKRTLAFVSLMVFSLIAKSYEPLIPFDVWNACLKYGQFLVSNHRYFFNSQRQAKKRNYGLGQYASACKMRALTRFPHQLLSSMARGKPS